MTNTLQITMVIMMVTLSSFISFTTNAYGHGLGGETHPPVTLDGRDVTLSIDISPSTFDPNEPEKYITVNLNESKSQAIVEHVTFTLEMKKDGEQIFRRIFHDDLGNLTIKVINDGSDEIKIKGDKSPGIDAWMRTPTEPVIMTGPVFDSGGLYDYKVEILAVDSDFNFLDKRLELAGAISLAENKTYEVNDSKQNTHQLNIISYFDSITNFEYNSDKISFSMPFDWNQDFEQLSVVHQEVRIPENFSEFLHAKYEARVNGILLDDDLVTIDDYSFDGRTIHFVINKEDLKEIREQAKQKSEYEMFFELATGKDIVLPVEATTPDLRYRVYLSWEPKIIKAGEDIIFSIKIEELLTNKSSKEIEYKLEINHEDVQIYKKNVSGYVNSETADTFQFKFLPENSGIVRLDMFEIEGHESSNVNFLIPVKASEKTKFPIELESMSESNPNNGKYIVDLTWFPNPLSLGESEFIMTFYEKDTGLIVPNVTYDFVLIKNGSEIHRKSGFASAGGTFENFVFVEREAGDIIVKIEKIAGTDEYVEISINVTPEFPLGISILLVTVIFLLIIISKTKYFKIPDLT